MVAGVSFEVGKPDIKPVNISAGNVQIETIKVIIYKICRQCEIIT
jgi:hypothetical protein